MNPYEPPNCKLVQRDSGEITNAKTSLLSLLVPAFVGAIVGSIVLAPITRGPGDPTGHGIAFGLAGLISLVGAIVFRTIKRSNASIPKNHDTAD